MSLRRHAVVLRPKVRSRRLKLASAALAVSVLGLLAAATLRNLTASLPPWTQLKTRLLPRIESAEVAGVPASLRGQIAAYARTKAGGAAAVDSEELLKRFECLRSVKARRDFRRPIIRFDCELRAALGRVEARGRPAGYLGENGALFTAPDGIYDQPLPALELNAAAPGELKALADFLREFSPSPDLPGALARMRYTSPEDGWQALLSDGTTVLWGNLDWTAEKLSRLKEVLRDARGRFEGPLTADLRYFEDGKVLLRPAGLKSVSMR